MDNGASSYRRFRDGDDNGLVEIIRDYKDGLIYFLYNIVGDFHIAEDLAEDTFVLLGTKKPRDKREGSFKTWLYTIGRNKAVDYLRKKTRIIELDLDEVTEIANQEDAVDLSYIHQERDMIIHREMQNLKAEYRQVLWLIYFEELSIKECSVIMKKNTHAIETLVYRARKVLRTRLEQEGFDYEDL